MPVEYHLYAISAYRAESELLQLLCQVDNVVIGHPSRLPTGLGDR